MEIFKITKNLKETLKLAKDLQVPYQIKIYTGLVFTLCNTETGFEVLGSTIVEEFLELEVGAEKNLVSDIIFWALLGDKITIEQIKALPQEGKRIRSIKNITFNDLDALKKLLKIKSSEIKQKLKSQIFNLDKTIKQTLEATKNIKEPFKLKLYSKLIFDLQWKNDDEIPDILSSSFLPEKVTIDSIENLFEPAQLAKINEYAFGSKFLGDCFVDISIIVFFVVYFEILKWYDISNLPQEKRGLKSTDLTIFTGWKSLFILLEQELQKNQLNILSDKNLIPDLAEIIKIKDSLIKTCDSLKGEKNIFKIEIYDGLVFTLQNIFLEDGKYSWLKIIDVTADSCFIKTSLFVQRLGLDWQKKQFETRTKNLKLDIPEDFSSTKMILFHGLYYDVFTVKDLQNLEQETIEENDQKVIVFKNLESLFPLLTHKDLAIIPLQKTFKESLEILEKCTSKEAILMLNGDFGLRMTRDESLQQRSDLAFSDNKIGYFGYTFAPAGDIGYYQDCLKKLDFRRTVANNFAVVKFTLILEEFIKQKKPELGDVWQEFVTVYKNYFPKDNIAVFRLTLTHFIFFCLFFEIFALKDLELISHYKILDEKSKWKDSFCYEADELLDLVEKQISHNLIFDAPDSDLDFDEVIMGLNQNDAISPQIKKDMIALAKRAFSPKDSGAKEDALTKFKLLWKYPFGKMTKDNKFGEIADFLEENLYGLHEAKTRAMRFLAQRELNPNATSQILCLVGEPGVGKTHFAQALAKAVGREFGSIPIGSLSDSKVLRGSSGVYIGSEAGDIFQICNKTQTTNPLILLDEIDKIASGSTGGSASVVSALLEIFDPLQQPFFKDNYANLPIDISKIWFITTANSIDQIHPALLDRMLILHLPSYNQKDKLQIFDKYIWPESLANSGLTNISWQQNAKVEFIGKFPEAGVRSLKNHTQDFCGMLAVEQLQNPSEGEVAKRIITKKLVTEYVNDVKAWKKDKTIGF